MNKITFRIACAVTLVLLLVGLMVWLVGQRLASHGTEQHKAKSDPVRVALVDTPSPRLESVPAATPAGGPGKAHPRIDAEHNDPASTLRWLLSRGARLMLVRDGGAVVGELDRDFRLAVPETVPRGDDVLRDVSREVRRATGQSLPIASEGAFLSWPPSLWQRVQAVIPSDGPGTHLTYEVRGSQLVVRDRASGQVLIVLD